MTNKELYALAVRLSNFNLFADMFLNPDVLKQQICLFLV